MNSLRQPILCNVGTGWVEKPDFQPCLRKLFQEPLVVPGGIVRKKENLHSASWPSVNRLHFKCAPFGRSRSNFLPTTRSRSNGMTPSLGAGLNALSISALNIV